MYATCRMRMNLNVSFRSFFEYLKTDKTILDEYTHKFEREFSEYIGSKYAVAVPSARWGLYSLLKALKINKNEEIIVSAYNTPIITNMIQEYGAKIVYVDADKETMNIDPTKIEKAITEKTKVIILTHMEGNPVDIRLIKELSKKYKLYMIEDCAHACGAKYHDKKVGSFGTASLFSFGLGKQINTLGGGIVCTNNKKIARIIKKDLILLKNQEKYNLIIKLIKAKIISFIQKPISFSILVYPFLLLFSKYDPINCLFEDTGAKSAESLNRNKKYSGIQALIGLEQLRNLDLYNKKVKKNVRLIKDNFKTIKFQKNLFNSQPAYLHLALRTKQIKKLRKNLLKRGIDARKTCMKNCSASKDKFPISQELQESTLYLPLYPQLKEKEIKKIIKVMKNIDLQKSFLRINISKR